jgi:hypothetical protein
MFDIHGTKCSILRGFYEKRSLPMNHKVFVSLFCVVFFALAFASCASSGKSAQNQAQDASPYFSGTGGKGVSIAILAPKASGLAKDQDYLPGLVQGDFVNNFKTYSAIEVLDRERLDDQYAELLSGYYDDTSEAGLDLGHLIPTAYLMTGNITRTAAGYALQIQITKTADKMTAASYSGTCTFAELDNLTLIRQASLDLLGKMGVTPTEKAQAVNGRAPSSANVRISMINEAPPPDNVYGFDLIAGEVYAAPVPGYSVIPASIWGVPVTSIGDDCEFTIYPKIGSYVVRGWIGSIYGSLLVVPDSVKRIGKNAINNGGTDFIFIGADVILHENE